ncbi:MAG: hypothetical protein Q8N63_04550 [Nanoarchaeota archaeon]|nr:hypothetical protein [Nanoarchaeota archaeon]
MKNSLWFTLNKQGYCVRYERDTSSACGSGYLIEPEKRVNFPALVKQLVEYRAWSNFYEKEIKVGFDSEGELQVPKEEQEAICSLVTAMETGAKQNASLRKRLEKIAEVVHEPF